MKNLLYIFLLISPTLSFAEKKASQADKKMIVENKNSNLEISVEKEKSGKTNLIFKVVPIGKIVINDADNVPWALKFTETAGASFSKNSFSRKEYDGNIPGFRVPVTAAKASKQATTKFKLVSFICTKSKDKCYREVHKGTFKWPSS